MNRVRRRRSYRARSAIASGRRASFPHKVGSIMNSISRRAMLSRSAVAGGTLLATRSQTAATSAAEADSAQQPKRTLKLIVTGGHPGDPEYGCGGTIARWTELGHDAVLLYLNDGGSPDGPKGLAATRVVEAAKAC